MAVEKVEGEVVRLSAQIPAFFRQGGVVGWVLLAWRKKRRPLRSLVYTEVTFFCDLSSFVDLWRRAK